MAKIPGATIFERREATDFEDLPTTRPAQRNSKPIDQQIIPSSSTDGFFQQPPPVQNQFHDDIALRRALKLFLPDNVRQATQGELTAFGEKVLTKEVLDLVTDAEKNLPYLRTWDSWGRRRDELVTSEGWRKLSALGIQEGMVAIGYENQYLQFSRPYQFCKYLIWTGSSAWVTCPSLMTDGVAALLRKHLSDSSLAAEQRRALRSAYSRLTSRDPEFAWTTGQWMTERQGGSDVSQTETLAQYAPYLTEEELQSTGTDGVPLGSWLCNGFKWFSSATDSSMMVFLARTPNGISTFMAPMRRTIGETSGPSRSSTELSTELNGIQIQRLKNKLGTRALPTAELVLKDVRAHLIGEEGNGVREIATVLNVARVHNAVTAIGFWGRGLSIIRAFARVRKVGLKPLWTKAAFIRTLAQLHVDYRANVLLSIFVASLLGVVEQADIDVYHKANNTEQEPVPSAESTPAIPDPEAAVHIYRLLTPVLKGLTAKAAIAGLSECMECMGGVGYLENDDMQFNIARLSRDVQVCSIWEGTTDMMSHDVIRVVFGKTGEHVMKAMDYWIESVLRSAASTARVEANLVAKSWREWKQFMANRERGEIELRSRSLMEKLGDVVMGGLLVLDASSDSDDVALDVMRTWFTNRHERMDYLSNECSWQQVVERNKRVVFGHDRLEEERARL